MIDLNELVYAINEYLGRDKFVLFLGTNGAPDKDENRVVGTVNIGVVPYAFSTDQIDAESLDITFTFDLPCGTVDDDFTRDIAVAEIAQKLIAWKKIQIDYVEGQKYVLNTFFKMLPMGNPYVDCGRITQQLVVTGKALLQNMQCGAIVGNNENVYINEQRLTVIDKTSATSITHDSRMPLSRDGYIPEIEAIAHSNTVRLTCLYLGTEIDRKLWDIGEGFIANPNEPFTLATELVLPDGTEINGGEKICKVVSVTNISSAGVFNRYEVTLQMLYEI